MDFATPPYSGCGLISFGDSFTVGQGASAPANAYAAKLAAYMGGSFSNRGVSGTGLTNAAAQAYASMPVYRRQVVSILAGFNDISAYGAPAYDLMKTELRSLLASCFLRENVPASALRRSGSWGNMTNVGGRANSIGGNGIFTQSLSAYLEWDFFGETLVVGSYTSHTGSAPNFGLYEPVNISIDGGPPQVLQTVGVNVFDNYAYATQVLKNLGLAKHTVRLSPIAGGNTTLDYVGTLTNPEESQSVVVGDIPTRTQWTRGSLTIDQQITDGGTAAIREIIAEFTADGWPVVSAPIGDFYNAADVGPDGIHPTDAGHLAIFNAFSQSIPLHV